MEFEPISTSRMIALMVAGGLFACVGLYLMVRPKPQGAAKIELFGLKFESSSAGLLVFIVGAAFLAVTLFVPEKPPIAEGAARIAPQDLPQFGQDATVDAVSDTTNLQLPVGETVEEKEPNDEQSDANTFALGQRIGGNVTLTAPDWFLMPLPERSIVGHEIMLKHVSGHRVRLDVYNSREEHVGYIEETNGARYLPIKTDFERYLHFKVSTPYTAGAQYEIAVLPGKN